MLEPPGNNQSDHWMHLKYSNNQPGTLAVTLTQQQREGRRNQEKENAGVVTIGKNITGITGVDLLMMLTQALDDCFLFILKKTL